MGKAEKERGKRGERLWRDECRAAGFQDARRGVQYSAAEGNADVVVPSMPGFWCECKFVDRLNITSAMRQATEQSGDLIPYVAHKRSGEKFMVTMHASDWFKLVKAYLEDA
jgi:hypothetical protein